MYLLEVFLCPKITITEAIASEAITTHRLAAHRLTTHHLATHRLSSEHLTCHRHASQDQAAVDLDHLNQGEVVVTFLIYECVFM